jgi:Prenyltransferase and squalene oxidase repeat
MVASGDVGALLARSRSDDGGYGSVPGAPSEPAATALASIALADDGGVSWLLRSQRDDGSFGIDAGGVRSDDTALVALALPDGAARERALDHIVATAGANAVDGSGTPPFGWSWTTGAHGWTEPTAWGVLALRRLRPSAAERIDDGLEALRVRACVGGGWNYGTPESFDIEQPPFVQTTAVALFAVAGADRRLTDGGLAALRARWRHENDGLLSLATTAAAFRSLGDPDAKDALALVEGRARRATDAGTVALAWSSIASGPGITSFEVT